MAEAQDGFHENFVWRITTPSALSERVGRHRDKLRAAGLHPVQIWVPDTRSPGFAGEDRRQSLLATEHDRQDADLMDFLDDALADIEEWEA